jgi:fatty acid synthase subunit alpha
MVVKDLGDLAYEETVVRLVRLMYVKHQSRWIDISLRNLLGDWLRRVEERFAGVNGKPNQSILQSYSSLNDPEPFVATFLPTHPEACQQLLAAEDNKYFLSIAQHPGQKPAPSIALLDVNFGVWFKSSRRRVDYLVMSHCRPR